MQMELCSRSIPLYELKGFLPELAEGAPAQRQVAAMLPVELLYSYGGFILHSMSRTSPYMT